MIRQVGKLVEKSLDQWGPNLVSYFNWLSTTAPVFSIPGSKIKIISNPTDFYETLLDKCRTAEDRILLTSLYLGNGSYSQNLVNAIKNRLEDRRVKLDVNILLDANRGSRGKMNSRQMLLPLVQNYPSCQVSMYHTPLLRGFLRYFLPQRYNELVGLQHMKIYLFDNDVIISGANLSEDYFTNRQDRYIMVSDCKELADFYCQLVQTLTSVSFTLDGNNQLKPGLVHPYKTPLKEYVKVAKKEIVDFYTGAVEKECQISPGDDTLLFPLIEIPPLEIHTDSCATTHLLDSTSSDCKVTLSTGYFNLTDEYSESIVSKSQAEFKLLMAHPTANGFDKASFPAGGIPQAYTAIAEGFTKRFQTSRISLHEYIRPGWTYHVKGLWLAASSTKAPFFTLVGSSNFGVRSVKRDVENSLAILTWNKQLSESLLKEQDEYLSYCSEFTSETSKLPDRVPPLWVRATLATFRSFF